MLDIPAGASVPTDFTRKRPLPEAHASVSPRPRASSRWITDLTWTIAALLLIASVGALKLGLPLHRDTATFMWMATQLDHGAVLYADVWDVKQPGVFVFAWVAGKLFGFTAQGLHVLGLAWNLTFAVVTIIALRPLMRHPWIAAVASVACLVPYYVYLEPYQQTQLEMLVALPLFITAWMSTVDWHGEGRRAAGFFAAGIAAGVATAFKHVLAPIPVAFVLTASVAVLRRGDVDGSSPVANRWHRLLLYTWMPFAAGVVLVWGGITLAFWRLGALEPFLATTFLYPLAALGAVPSATLGRLALSVSIFVVAMAPWLIYASWGLVVQLREKGPALFGQMVVWFVTGTLVFLLQKSSWWAYHMLLLYAPVGVLAARGLDLILERITSGGTKVAITPAHRGLGAPVIAAFLVVPLVAANGFQMAKTAHAVLINVLQPGNGLERYQRQVSSDYTQAADAAAFLSAHAPDGPVYVFGDPTILLLSGRSSALPEQGSAWGFYLPDQWRRLPDALRTSTPVWVFLEELSRPTVEQISPETAALLHDHYRVVWSTPYGRWFERNNIPPHLPPVALHEAERNLAGDR